MPAPGGALAAVAVGKKIYVVGGAGIPKGMQLPDGLSGGGPVDLLGTTEVLDTDTNTWTSVAPMPTPRNHHSVAYVEGKIYAIGGPAGSGVCERKATAHRERRSPRVTPHTPAPGQATSRPQPRARSAAVPR